MTPENIDLNEATMTEDTDDRTPRQQAEAALEAAADTWEEHGDGPEFAAHEDVIDDLPESGSRLFAYFAAQLRGGSTPQGAVDDAMNNAYDAPIIEGGSCHPGDLEYFRDWFEHAYGHDGSEENGDPDGPFMDAYEVEESS